MQVAALTAAGGTKVDHEKPYAELWYVIEFTLCPVALAVPARHMLNNLRGCTGWGHIQAVQQCWLLILQ